VKFTPHPTTAFTTKASGIVRELRNQIYVSEVYDPNTGSPEPVKKPYNAIWDTGATGTVISRKIAQELNLQATGRERVQTVGAGDKVNEYETDTYLVNLYLPNQLTIIGVRAAEGTIAEADVLLGMDIIARGDFAITNFEGKTHWTFRFPSNESIDFVEQIKEYKKKYSQNPPLSPEELRKKRNREKAERQRRR